MKKIVYIGILVTLWSCQRGDNCFTSKGANGIISRKLEVFDKISIENRLNLIITQDSTKAGEVGCVLRIPIRAILLGVMIMN